MNQIVLNRTFAFDLAGQVRFGELSTDTLYTIFKDGRNASFMLEEWLTLKFPLTRVLGNRDHDHVDELGNKYDAKNFTKGGLKFMPSNQIGAGRQFNKEIAHQHAGELIYICCDIVDFPRIRVRFINGSELMATYPKCSIPFRKRESLFADET